MKTDIFAKRTQMRMSGRNSIKPRPTACWQTFGLEIHSRGSFSEVSVRLGEPTLPSLRQRARAGIDRVLAGQLPDAQKSVVFRQTIGKRPDSLRA